MYILQVITSVINVIEIVFTPIIVNECMKLVNASDLKRMTYILQLETTITNWVLFKFDFFDRNFKALIFPKCFRVLYK